MTTHLVIADEATLNAMVDNTPSLVCSQPEREIRFCDAIYEVDRCRYAWDSLPLIAACDLLGIEEL